MSIDFTLEALDDKPKKKNSRKKRSSKYQPILDEFLSSEHSLVRVSGTGLSAAYLSIILNKIIKKKGIDNIKVSVRNQEVYLENVN